MNLHDSVDKLKTAENPCLLNQKTLWYRLKDKLETGTVTVEDVNFG